MLRQKEIECVLLSLLREDDAGSFRRRPARFSDNDWEALYNLGCRHDLLPALYRRLSDLGSEGAEPEFVSKLKNYYILNLRTNILFERELSEILRSLSAADIEAIPLKGPALARYLHGDIALRTAGCDLDILIPRERVKEAEERLEGIGYCFCHGAQNADFFHRFREHIVLNKKMGEGHRILLDLHWGLRNRFTPTHLSDLWLNARTLDIDGVRILMPSHEDLLIYLVLVTISDFDFVRIKYLYDLHNLITDSTVKIDWPAVISKAKKHGLATALFFALKLSRELFNTAIPTEALDNIRPFFIKERLLGLWINKKNILQSQRRVASSFAWRYVISCYSLSKNILAALRVAFEKIFLPMEEVMGYYNKVPANKSYFLYIKRLLKPVFGKKKKHEIH